MSERRTRLVLIRHAQHDPHGRILQHACEGLTSVGAVQAHAVAARLRTLMEPYRVAAVLSSVARRTIETAEAIAAALDVERLPPTCDLCEMHAGEAEGLTEAEMRARFGYTLREVPGGEHYPDWLPRATKALHRIATTWAGRTVICVTHSGVVRASFVAFGKMPYDEAFLIQAANTSITEWSCGLEKEPGRPPGVWRLDRYNDTAHLD